MARGIAILGPDDLTITQNDPEFSPLVARDLGDEITDKDGWDAQISELVQMFDGGDDLLVGMAGHLVDAAFIPGDVDAGLLSPLASDTADLVTQGQPLFDSMSGAVVPPGGAGDGGGGGGAGGGGGGAGGGGTGGGGTGSGPSQPPAPCSPLRNPNDRGFLCE